MSSYFGGGHSSSRNMVMGRVRVSATNEQQNSAVITAG
jgi:hypothetical protein